MTKTRNARFWEYINGSLVRLTLRPNESLSWGKSWRHEEGWSSESYSWTHEGDRLRVEMGTDGHDCDGRSSSWAEYACPLDMLMARVVNDVPVPMPAWVRVDSEQRDYAAEAAGY